MSYRSVCAGSREAGSPIPNAQGGRGGAVQMSTLRIPSGLARLVRMTHG